jgi:hypothetical protein
MHPILNSIALAWKTAGALPLRRIEMNHPTLDKTFYEVLFTELKDGVSNFNSSPNLTTLFCPEECLRLFITHFGQWLSFGGLQRSTSMSYAILLWSPCRME